MESVGLQHERLQMHYCSAAEGQRFQKTMVEMAKQIATLGPSPLRKLAPPPTPKPNPNTKKEPKKKK